MRRKQIPDFSLGNDETADKNEEVIRESNEEVIHEENVYIVPKSSAWSRFWGRLAVMKYVILILILPPVLNYAALMRESAALVPVEGQQVDVGWGQKLFIRCLGTGLPTVILDASTGGTSDIWYMVQEKLSIISKVCVYDRAGLGFSSLPSVGDSSQKQKKENRKFISQIATLEQMSQDLNYLVTEAKPLPRPFIIVGSETGGLVARHYALVHPTDVSDIVLINPLVEDLFTRQKEDWNIFWHSQVLPSLQSLQLSAFVGLSRIAVLTGWLKPDITGDSVPREVEYRQYYHLCNPSHMDSVFYEHLLLNTSFSQMSEVWQTKPFPINISVTIITSRQFEKIPPGLYEAWEQSQLYLRQSLHPTSSHLIFDGSLGSLYNEPITITNKVQDLVYRWRTGVNVLPTIPTIQESIPEQDKPPVMY